MTVSIERIDNWDVALNKYIVSVKDTPFEYGTHDCCTFTAGAVKAITGVDYMREFRGMYSCVDSADEALATIGNKDLFRTLIRKFGKPLKGIYGHKGDVAFNEGCCGIVIGKYAMFISAGGYGIITISHVQRIFRIG